MNYSVIIPHKNCPELLQRCLNSIPLRDDLEVIIVDDHSDESITKDVSFPGKNRDNTFVVFLTENKGAGYARNIGIEKSKGKWLLFADADDYYTNAINGLLDKYSKDEDTSLVYLNAQLVYEGTDKVMPYRVDSYIRRFNNKKFYSEKVLRYGVWTPWTRMVKRELVQKYNIRYETIPTGNDVMFCLNCSRYADRISSYVPIIYNYYQPQKKSITANKRKKLDNLPSTVDLLFRHIAFNDEVGYLCGNSVRALYKHPMYDGSYEEYKSALDKLLKERKYSHIKDTIHFLLHSIAYRLHII